MVTCPNCQAENVAGSAFCDNCGFALATPAPAAAPTASAPAAPAPNVAAMPSQQGMNKCAVCGTMNDPSNTYCENCGSPLTPASVAVSDTPLPMPTPTASAPPPMPTPQATPQPAAIVNPPEEIPAPVATSPLPVVTPPPAVNALPKMIIPTPGNQPPPAGHPRLVVVSSGAYFDLDGYTDLLIGRVDPTSNNFPEVDLTAHGGDEGGVSRRHARITLAGNQYFIEDLHSSNGSWIGTNRLASQIRIPLNHGDQLRFGKVVLNFYAS